MKLNKFLFLSIMMVAVFFIQSCSSPNPRENIDTAIEDAISLLENNDITGLVKSYIPPERLADMLKKNDLKDIVSKNMKTRDALLAALRSAKLLKPEYSEDLKTVVFRTKPQLRMIKIDGYWYIQ